MKSKGRGQAHGLVAAREKARVAREVADRYRALREVLVQRDPAGVTPQFELRILEAHRGEPAPPRDRIGADGQ